MKKSILKSKIVRNIVIIIVIKKERMKNRTKNDTRDIIDSKIGRMKIISKIYTLKKLY